MLNTYGPTETTVVATYAECTLDAPVTIGRPMPGYSAYVLDDDKGQVRVGETGELYIGGASVARGYLGLPKRTAESFLSNPFRGPRGTDTRLFRTGDQVRVMRDRRLQYVGRLDSQVKIRGFRIELAEIEAVLIEHASVRAAAVAVHRRREENELAAFVVPRDPSKGVDREAIADFLRSRLPTYMIPKYLEIVQELPEQQSGKIDRTALPLAKTLFKGTAGKVITPRNKLEQQVAQIWCRLFGVQRVSIDDDFFLDLGGHSLLAAQAVSTLPTSNLLGVVSIPPSDHQRTPDGTRWLGSPSFVLPQIPAQGGERSPRRTRRVRQPAEPHKPGASMVPRCRMLLGSRDRPVEKAGSLLGAPPHGALDAQQACAR